MKKKTQWLYAAMIPAGVMLAGWMLWGCFGTESFGVFLEKALYSLSDNWGWWFMVVSMLALVFALSLVVFKYGDIKIGGKDAKPDFGYWNWCVMSICGGIGTGILFWAMGEPMYHFMMPPVAVGVEGGSRDAAVFAIAQTMWHWSFVQYCLYAVVAVGFALLIYNWKKPLSLGSVIEGATGRQIPWLRTLFHIIIIFFMTCSVSNSMGVGLMQIGAGLNNVFGVSENAILYFFIAAVIGIIFIVSCVSGISKGLKYVSNTCMYGFIILMLYVLVFGNTPFISKLGMESFGNMMDNIWSRTAIFNAMAEEDLWPADWIIQYFAALISVAPMIGMFLSRMAKGRTIREFVLVQVLVPSLFCIVWIAIWGGQALFLQTSGTLDIWASVQQLGMQHTIYLVLSSFPGGKVLIILFLVTVCLSFCTYADPMSAALATLCTKNLEVDDEAPRALKIIVGVTFCVVSWALVVSGGTNSIRGMFTIDGLIVSLICLFIMVTAFIMSGKTLKSDKHGIVPLKYNESVTSEE